MNELAKKTLVMVVGPSAIGKTTVMHAAVESNPAFGYVRSFTTRTKRSGEESSYIHYTQGQVDELARDQNIVTKVTHPTTGDIYGTTLESYPAEFNLLDTLSSTVAIYRDIPFERAFTVSVTTDVDTWRAWFDQRYSVGNSQRRNRLVEAKQSVEWSLQQGDDHAWIMNNENGAELAAKELIAICYRNATVKDHIGSAKAMLETIDNLLSYEQE